MSRHYLKIVILLLAAALAATGTPTHAAPGEEPIVVDSADPEEAEQGQELDVIIRGSGFKKGAKVEYLVSETEDNTQIEVLSTDFIDEFSLKSRIRIKETALVAAYDIVVQSGRRKGKGTTRFSVLPFQTPNDGLVEISSTGAVSLLANCVEPVDKSSTTIGCNGNDGGLVAITLGGFFMDRAIYSDGALGSVCFSGGPTFIGTVQLADNFGSEDDQATFRFEALNAVGLVQVHYVLTISDPHLGGWSEPPGFPPGKGETTTLIGTHWSLKTFKKDKRHDPCTGSGELSGTDIVTVGLTWLY
jgi:hypothetical protein